MFPTTPSVWQSICSKVRRPAPESLKLEDSPTEGGEECEPSAEKEDAIGLN